jgi:hypothetical protein
MHTQIGVSAFRIDLGVVHPDMPGIYLAGIECDGATYHRSATARDRDKLRQHVLRDLGWSILRVWSTDWWIDRETTLNKLDTQLRTLLEQYRQRPLASRAPQPLVSWPADRDIPIEGGASGIGAGHGEYRHIEAAESQAVAPVGPRTDTEHFFDRSYDETLGTMVADIVENEGPILDEVLARRIARMHGWQRTGTRITERVTRVAARTFKKTKEDVGSFFWPSNLAVGQPVPFRSGLGRSVDEVCRPELLSLALDILQAGNAGDDAVGAMARALGLQRLRAISRPRLSTALARAKRRIQDQIADGASQGEHEEAILAEED